LALEENRASPKWTLMGYIKKLPLMEEGGEERVQTRSVDQQTKESEAKTIRKLWGSRA